MAIPFIGKAIEGVISIIDKVVPDKAEATRIKGDLEKMSLKGDLDIQLAQIHVNALEAQSQSAFARNWRPAVGWICVLGLFWNFIVYPAVMYYAVITGAEWAAQLPQADASVMMPLIFAMLGFGAYRTYEKNGRKT
jgi:hypothetical protein